MINYLKNKYAVIFQLQQEELVTTQINALLSMARAESDYTADNFLQWFVKEQLEGVAWDSCCGLFSVLARAICWTIQSSIE